MKILAIESFFRQVKELQLKKDKKSSLLQMVFLWILPSFPDHQFVEHL